MNDIIIREHLVFFKQNIADLRNPDIYPKIEEYFDRTVFLNNIDFLEKNNLIIEDHKRNSSYSITPKGEKLLSRITKEIEYNAEKERIEFENLKSSTDVNKYLIKTKWYPLAISVIAVLVSIVLGFKDDTKINELEERLLNIQKKLEVTKNEAKPSQIYPKQPVEKVPAKKSENLK